MTDLTKILNASDMEKSRTPQELYDWVCSKAGEFSQTKEARKYARSGARLPKKLWEEIRPLAIFALCRYGNKGVRCTPNLSNENYDGLIDFPESGGSPVYVELTYAKDGYDERHRLQVLTENGSVNALGKMAVSGTKKSGQLIHVEDEAIDHEKMVGAALELVVDRLRGKCNKQYGENHVLVVVVDDYLQFRADDDKKVLMDRVRSTLAMPDMKMNVGAVYLLGSSGEYCARAVGEI